jgi:predicted nucleotide-binding protein
MTVTKITLAGLVDSTPGSSAFRELLLSSRAYGLTEGGVNANEFSLTELGARATSDDSGTARQAHREAVLYVEPFRTFLSQFDGKKVPARTAFAEFLVGKAGVPQEWAEDCIKHLLADAQFVGFLTDVKGSEYVVTRQSSSQSDSQPPNESPEAAEEGDQPSRESVTQGGQHGNAFSNGEQPQGPISPVSRKSIFVAHGKNRKPLEQLKSLLAELGVPFKVAVDEPHAGRPVGEKVASMMRDECSSAICIFSADERFLREDEDGNQTEVWRPSENAVYELGAASVLYGRRIILFKEDKVTLPSDFRDIGHITFKNDEIHSHMLELLRELKAHGLVEVVVPSYSS